MPTKIKVPEHLRDIFTQKDWNRLDSFDRQFLAASSWQDPSNFATHAVTATSIVDFFPFSGTDDSKSQDVNWRDLQIATYLKYKTFPPLNSAVDSKADYVAGAGFSIYSDILEVNEFLKDLNYSYRNRLYSSYGDWIRRMLAESELFILIALDETGTATVRNIEPSRIGEGDDTGLIVDTEDVTQTIFYKYKAKDKVELIPDVRFVLEPEYMATRVKLLENFDKTLISDITRGKGGFSKIGGYRRFILHWKNLTGTKNIKRDVSSLATTIQWANLYEMAIKWDLDYRRALSSWTLPITFSDTPAGKIAWQIWQKMTNEQRAATDLTKPLSPGSRLFLMPGMTIDVKAPNLSAMHGNNQELLNLAGAGARTPQDMFQGQSSGATYAALRTSRPPLIAEIDNLQAKFEQFLRYEFLRICFKAKTAMGGSFISLDGKTKYKLLEQYQTNWIDEVKNGKGTIKKINAEPIETIKIVFPSVSLETNPQEKANAFMGSKHTGLYGLGISAETITRKMGIDDLTREKRKQLIEQEQFGVPISGLETPLNALGAQKPKEDK